MPRSPQAAENRPWICWGAEQLSIIQHLHLMLLQSNSMVSFEQSALPLLPIKMTLFTAAWVTAKSSTPLLHFPESFPSSQLPVQQRCYCCTGAQSLKHCPDETKARGEPPLSPQQRWGQQGLFFPEFPDLPEKASSTSEWVTKKTTFPYTMEFLKKNLYYRRMRLL